MRKYQMKKNWIILGCLTSVMSGVKISHANAVPISWDGMDPVRQFQAQMAAQPGTAPQIGKAAPVRPAKDAAKDEALLSAAEKGDTKKVEKLLANGADPNAKTSNAAAVTVLMFAALHGHEDIVRILLSHNANPNAKNGLGQTALMYAAWDYPPGGPVNENHRVAVVRTLISGNADVNDVDDYDQGAWTVLMYAANNGYSKTVEFLVGVKGIDLNHRDNFHNCTALWMARNQGHKDIVKILEKAGAVE